MELFDSNCFECDSMESFLHIILNGKLEDNSTHLYFRGESKYHKYIIPSLYLNEKLTMISSEYYFRSLLSQLGSQDYSNSFELFKLMSEFQHYGAKTRVLDITSNPLIALYFAVEKYCDEDLEHGYIYIYGSFPKIDRKDRDGELFDVGHTVAIKSALNLIPQTKVNAFFSACKSIKSSLSPDEWNELKNYPIEDLKIGSIQLNKKKLRITDDQYYKIQVFIDLLNQRAKTHEILVYPFVIFEDLNRANIVIPSKCTDRIKQQQGAFIFPKYVFTEDKKFEEIQKEIDDSVSTLLTPIITDDGRRVFVIIIPGDKKKRIKEELSRLGITEGFVYPEIEHRSNALLNNFYN